MVIRCLPAWRPEAVAETVQVDPQDWEWLNQWEWIYHNGYAQSHVDGKTVLMHRLIANAPKGTVVDHINRDRLDNRRKNLRVVTVQANGLNRRPNVNNSSGETGVYKTDNGNYRAQIAANDKDFNLGTYTTKTEAVHAYQLAHKRMKQLHGIK